MMQVCGRNQLMCIAIWLNVENVLAEFQMDMVDLRHGTGLKTTHRHIRLLDLNKLSLLFHKVPLHIDHARLIKSLIVSTYVNSPFQKWKWSRLNLEIDSTTKDRKVTPSSYFSNTSSIQNSVARFSHTFFHHSK
jgi:hypothetical protein